MDGDANSLTESKPLLIDPTPENHSITLPSFGKKTDFLI